MRFFPIYVPETCPVHQYHPHKLDIFNCQKYFPACVMLRDVKVSVVSLGWLLAAWCLVPGAWCHIP